MKILLSLAILPLALSFVSLVTEPPSSAVAAQSPNNPCGPNLLEVILSGA